MTNRSSTSGYLRQYGSTKQSSPAVFEAVIRVPVDPTVASAPTGFTLPSGAIPLGAQSLGGATGGANPTIDVGTLASSAGFANELPADAVDLSLTAGVLNGIQLTADTPVYAGVGASAATGGTTTFLLKYVMSDDGSH